MFPDIHFSTKNAVLGHLNLVLINFSLSNFLKERAQRRLLLYLEKYKKTQKYKFIKHRKTSFDLREIISEHFLEY